MTSRRYSSAPPITNATAARFGWHWIWRSLLCRRWELAGVLVTTLCVYVASLALPIFTQRAVDAVVARDAGPFLVLLGAGALLAIVAEAVFTNLRASLVIGLGGFLDQRIANLAFLHLMRMRLDVHGHVTGDLINRFQQAGKIKNFVLHLVPTIVFDIGNAIISLLLMLYFDAVIAAVVFVATLGCTALLKGRLDRLYDLADDHYKTEGERQSALSETVTGLATIKALAVEGWRYREWAGKTAAVVAAARRVSTLARRFSMATQLASRGLALLVIAIGCYRVLQGDLTVGELLALQLLVARVTTPIIQSGDVLRQYQEVAVAIAALRAFLAAPREVPGLRPGRRRFVDGGLDARNVTLVYPKSSRPALDDVSFSLPGAGVFAVVGRNGSGKTSLLRVLLGLQREFEGQALIYGEEVRDYDPRWLRSRIGVVDQDTVLLSGSIRDNVSLGLDGVDEAQVREALSFADALSFVGQMPGGIDAEITEHGRNLSGGQRQRLSIARAVVRDPQIVFLDEPTAFLDAEAAVGLEQKLTSWGRGRLLILVSHHLAATRSADQILVLDQGRLVGQGRHGELLRGCAVYETLWRDYLRSLEGTGESAPVVGAAQLGAWSLDTKERGAPKGPITP